MRRVPACEFNGYDFTCTGWRDDRADALSEALRRLVRAHGAPLLVHVGRNYVEFTNWNAWKPEKASTKARFADEADVVFVFVMGASGYWLQHPLSRRRRFARAKTAALSNAGLR